MKKFLVSILACIYLSTSVGATVQLHYCMSDLVGWELSSKISSSSCASCGMQKQGHKGCCHDEKKIIKTDKDQKNVDTSFNSFKTPVAFINTDCSIYNSNYLSDTIEELPSSHAPPYKLKVPFYIYNCVFRV